MDNLADKRVLVTGVTGQVGGVLAKQLQNECQLVAAARSGADIELDLSDLEQVKHVLNDISPDVVINAAAYTQVDKAEGEPDAAKLINADAPGVMARECRKLGALLVHYSTDYVYDGVIGRPLKESDPLGPLNVYGRTKLLGEQAILSAGCRHLIFRLCWVYDAEGRNFINAILDRAHDLRVLKVVNDQHGTPSWAGFIAPKTIEIIDRALGKEFDLRQSDRIYNLCPDGHCTWYDFAQSIVQIASQHESLAVEKIMPVTSSEFEAKAERPSWSVMDNRKIKEDFAVEIKSWGDYLSECLVGSYID